MKKQRCPHCHEWIDVDGVGLNVLVVCPYCHTNAMIVEGSNFKLTCFFALVRVLLAIAVICLFALKITPHSYFALGLLIASIVFEENILSQHHSSSLKEIL